VPLSDRVAVVLSEHIAVHPPVTARLPFGKPDGKPVSVRLLFSDGAKPARHQSVNDRIWKPALRAAEWRPPDLTTRYRCTRCATSPPPVGSPAARASKTSPSISGTRTRAFTLGVYAHLMPSAADKVRAAMDASLAECAPDVPALAAVPEN